MTNEHEIIDSQNDTETTENQMEVDLDLSEETTESESVEELKKKINTLEAQKNHWKEKANKTKDEKSEVKSQSKPEAESVSISAKDALLMAKFDIDIEDVDEVVDFANYRKVSIAEALKNPTLKAIIKDRQEERQTAAATQTRGPRVSPRMSDEAMLDRARQGQVPETDIDKLTSARMAGKLKKVQ